ncbi:hypothetical protein CUMW_187740 [Citrus unshiu]|uniref:Myb/SANT-like domain-containing protein n=1 Tax=Citrus unshiu TaxID=55188 RepID=A0A2H5Q1L7_CITUN|nr:hypothetical protein CUMW_187740 [Citrus unshiu]
MATDGVSQAATNKNYNRKQHRNRWDIVKKEWHIWDELVRGEIRLGWNVERQTIEVTNEWREKHLEAAKFWIKGLNHAFMLDELFHDITTTGERAWAPTSGVTPPLYNHSSFENIIEDDIAPVDSANFEQVNHDEIGYTDRLEKIPPIRKQLKKANKKRSIASKLTKQLDELCEAIKNKDSYIRTDPPDCSVQEVDKVDTLPGCQPMSPLFKLDIRLFTKKENKETFVT